jgi:hypothetical protein
MDLFRVQDTPGNIVYCVLFSLDMAEFGHGLHGSLHVQDKPNQDLFHL